jgi:hypothetical protein
VRNEQQFQVTLADGTIRAIGADRYAVEGPAVTFYEDLGPGTPAHPVASFPFDAIASVIRSEPPVEYG